MNNNSNVRREARINVIRQRLQNLQESTKTISVGDKYITTNPGNAFGGERIVVSKVENADSLDGFVYFRTEKLIHRRKNQCVRVW